MMAKIVFINPSVEKYAKVKVWASDLMDAVHGKRIAVMPKMAPMILAAVTPPEHSFTFIDEEIEDVVYDKIDADLIALTGMTVQADRAYEIADEFKKRGLPVVIGGVHASVLPDEAALHCAAVVIGEGENVWPELLRDFSDGRMKARYNAKDCAPVTEIISPNIDILKIDQYSVLPLQATKGCPFDCDFCSVSFVNGRRVRIKPIERLLAEIAAYERHNKGPFKRRYQFVDDNLYVNRAYTIELFMALKRSGILWHGQGTLNTVMDEEVLGLLAESGCRMFSVGFESVSEASLREVNKDKANRVSEYGKAVANLMKHGIVPGGFFIFGFDSDGPGVFEDTIKFIFDKHIINPSFCILTPFPGTRVAERIDERIFSRRWKEYGVVDCVFKPKNMTPAKLVNGSRWACRQIIKPENIKRQFSYFWSQGPWKTNPTLTLAERAALIALSVLARKRSKELRGLAFWAATQKNAVDFFLIMSALILNDAISRSMAEDLNERDFVY